jgi:hypothetical protein
MSERRDKTAARIEEEWTRMSSLVISVPLSMAHDGDFVMKRVGGYSYTVRRDITIYNESGEKQIIQAEAGSVFLIGSGMSISAVPETKTVYTEIRIDDLKQRLEGEGYY